MEKNAAIRRSHGLLGGSPIGYHNCVVRAMLAPQDADSAIVSSCELMRAKAVPGSWHVGPSMRPSDLWLRLEAHGFTGAVEPGMAADLERLPDVEMPAGLQIERIRSTTDLDSYARVLSLGFGEGAVEAAWLRTMYERIGVDNKYWQHFLGRLEGRPVATASVLLAAGVAGLYFVNTVPAERGRGFGTAMSRWPLIGAHDMGYRVGVLGSSPMGHGLYEQLGFHDVCEVLVYEWSPA